MNNDILLNDLQRIFQIVLKKSDLVITPDLTAADVPEWDSLNHLLLITEVEKHFQIKFKLKELISMECVGDMIDLVKMKVSNS
jgi:acyl carrier protein